MNKLITQWKLKVLYCLKQMQYDFQALKHRGEI